MPNYFPENDTALPTDSSERSMAKVVSQLPAALDLIGLEPETAVYVARSGATDVAAIDAFVKGVKELGLWNSMVCWPLRSSQNKGSGNIVYSLGGFGNYDGTMLGGPTWGPQGVIFTAANNHIVVTPFVQKFDQDSTWLFAAIYRAPVGGLVPRLVGTRTQPHSMLTVNVINGIPSAGVGLNTWSTVNSSTRVVSFATTVWHSYGVSFDYANSTARYLLDGTTGDVFRAPSSPVDYPAQIAGGQNPDNNWDGTIAYAVRVSTTTSSSQMLALSSLLKSTLGAGITLP